LKRLCSLNQLVRTTGITLFALIVVSGAILLSSPTDSGQRGFGHGAVNAVRWLDLLWFGVAVIAVKRKQVLPKYFWPVFATNITVCALIVTQLWSA